METFEHVWYQIFYDLNIETRWNFMYQKFSFICHNTILRHLYVFLQNFGWQTRCYSKLRLSNLRERHGWSVESFEYVWHESFCHVNGNYVYNRMIFGKKSCYIFLVTLLNLREKHKKLLYLILYFKMFI